MSQEVSAAIALDGSGLLGLGRGDAEVMRLRAPATHRDPDPGAGMGVVPDDDLVARTCDGDRDAFALLVSRYQDRIYSVTHSFVRDPDDALDLVQDTFLKAFQALPRFRGGSSFYTWLYRIAVNNCKDFLRRRAARPSFSLEDEPLQEIGFEPASADPECDPAHVAERKELRSAVRAAVAMLPDKLRMAVVLHDIEGLPQQDVADILKCPLGTVKSHVFRGRARLRKLLGSYVEGEA